MKTWTALVLAFILILALAGCGSTAAAENTPDADETADGWDAAALSPAEEWTAPEHITIELASYTKIALVAELTNSGSEPWTYGAAYSIQVLLDETWYVVPAAAQNTVIPSIAYGLPAGETREEIYYYYSVYGDLPAGTYRLVVDGAAAEFTL